MKTIKRYFPSTRNVNMNGKSFYQPRVTERGQLFVLERQGGTLVQEERNDKGERHGVYLAVRSSNLATKKTKGYFVNNVPVFITVKVKTLHYKEVYRTRFFDDGRPFVSLRQMYGEEGFEWSFVRYRDGFPFEIREKRGKYDICWDKEGKILTYLQKGQTVESYVDVSVTNKKEPCDDVENMELPSGQLMVTFSGKLFSRVYATNSEGKRVRLQIPVFSQ